MSADTFNAANAAFVAARAPKHPRSTAATPEGVENAPGSPPVAIMLRLEALGVLSLAVTAYWHLGFSWWLFAAVILVPDLSAIGYAGGGKAGAWCYDLAHTYVLPALLAAIGYGAQQPLLMALAAIWVAHISGDRLIGYGLKFSGSPKDTHLSRAAR